LPFYQFNSVHAFARSASIHAQPALEGDIKK